MRDLANERAEVALRLKELNFEPVIAEELLPNGSGSWDLLRKAIESCDVFVLLLGESYGYIPTSGPMAEAEKSVTELEFEVAKAAGIPILTFMKRLRPQGTPPDEDAQRRDHFRKEVSDWDGGLFRGEFDLARDLAEQVGQAIVGLIADHFRATQLEERRAMRDGPAAPAKAKRPNLPHGLKEAVESGRLTLLLGAGASLSTGMPSAAAFIAAMQEKLKKSVPGYEPPASGTLFNALATDYELLLGAESLGTLAAELVDPPYVTESHTAHQSAAHLFNDVITTNFDCLLERAAGGEDFHVIDDEAEEVDLSQPRRIFKIHGSITNPSSLVLTEPALANLENQRPRLWAALRDLLSRQPILAVGSSLRDPSLIRLLEECRPQIRGWAVMPDFNPSEQMRLSRWNLSLIQGDADSVLTALAGA